MVLLYLWSLTSGSPSEIMYAHFFSRIWQFLIGLDAYQKCSNDFLHCVCVCFFLTIQISLTLFKVLLSDSLLRLVKNGAEKIASCQNQPTNHWWWANVSALSAHGECCCFLNSSIMFKWKMVQSGLQTDLNSVLDQSIQSLAEDQGGS